MMSLHCIVNGAGMVSARSLPALLRDWPDILPFGSPWEHTVFGIINRHDDPQRAPLFGQLTDIGIRARGQPLTPGIHPGRFLGFLG
jgi:hypothetical protein